ncbi:MAG: hypothetical protein LDL41_13285, partial [Coleofasciculus sp. S288]|nr:hypothetical protein [Coleofasciculus sp. S288]
MSKNTSVESSTRSSPHPLINPTLQAALSCLDVQLEEELGRYRRQRAGRPVMSPRGLGRHQIRKPIDLISVDKSGGQPQQPVSAQLPAASMPMLSIPLALANPAPAEASAKETPNQPIAKTGQMDTASAATAEPADVRVTPSSSNEAVSPAIAQDSMSEQLAPPEEPKQVEGDLVHSPAPQSPPEDYLESSEQLLRSLGEEEVESQPEKRFTDRLLTPLGVGLMLLVLLSSATVVYIATNPSALKALGLNQFLGSKTSTTAQSPTETTQAKVEPAKEAAALDGPNLAAEEFPEVNLDSLSQLETSPSPIPSSPSSSTIPAVPDLPNSQAAAPPLPVAPNQSVPGRSSDLGAALLPSALQPGAVAPAPTAPSGVPIPAPAAPPSA